MLPSFQQAGAGRWCLGPAGGPMPEPRAQVPLEASRWDWAGGRVTTGDCFIWHLALFLQIDSSGDIIQTFQRKQFGGAGKEQVSPCWITAFRTEKLGLGRRHDRGRRSAEGAAALLCRLLATPSLWEPPFSPIILFHLLCLLTPRRCCLVWR